MSETNPKTPAVEPMHERPLTDLVESAILDVPTFGARWLDAPGDPTDSRYLVADSVKTHVRQEWGREEPLEAVRNALEGLDRYTIVSLMQGPPSLDSSFHYE